MRIEALKTEYQLSDLSLYILGSMKSQKINQSDMAAVLDMTQSNFSKKLKNCTLTARDLMIIFKKLGTPTQKVGELLGGIDERNHQSKR